jgi:hypothetical protein
MSRPPSSRTAGKGKRKGATDQQKLEEDIIVERVTCPSEAETRDRLGEQHERSLSVLRRHTRRKSYRGWDGRRDISTRHELRGGKGCSVLTEEMRVQDRRREKA